MWLDNDQHYMRLALTLARQGQYTARPNPCVGCVIVENDQVIASGWHRCAGESHAERMALSRLHHSPCQATVYITLEPCNHYGHTPPCLDALLQLNLQRVVIAMADPNPQMQGKSIQALRQADIQVDVGLLAQQARQLNAGFVQRMQQGRPWVRCKIAMSLDGRTAMASGESQWITGSKARLDGQTLRAKSGAIITGIETILRDDAQLTVRSDRWSQAPLLTIEQPWRVIIDSQLRIPLTAKLLASNPHRVIIVCAQMPEEKKVALEQLGVTILAIADANGKVDLSRMLTHLAVKYAVNDVLLESGASLAGAFLQAGLIDEIYFYMAAKLLGHDARAAFNLPGLQQLSDHVSLKVESSEDLGDDKKFVVKLVKKNVKPLRKQIRNR